MGILIEHSKKSNFVSSESDIPSNVLRIKLPIHTCSMPLKEPVECCDSPAYFKSFTHTFVQKGVHIKIPSVWGYECTKCRKRYLLNDTAQDIIRKAEMISDVLRFRSSEKPEAIQELGLNVVRQLLTLPRRA